MRKCFFHEDDYCQIEILPLNNMSFCLEQLHQIDQFSEEHKDGAGWNDIYTRKTTPIELSTMLLSLDKIRQNISRELPEYDQVETGYSSYRELCPDIYAFGHDEGPTLFVQINEQQIATAIWCSDPTPTLTQLPLLNSLLFVDWGWSFICPLSDTERYHFYLAERAQAFAEMKEKWMQRN